VKILRAILSFAWLTCFAVSVSGETKPPPNAAAHWAFHSPKTQPLPTVRNASWCQTEIDRFILARLERDELVPSDPADARTLIRRMAFDLTGLPPSANEVEEFAAAASRDRGAAIKALIERLLNSPGYGEQWGRHWLDVARYSDTKGYVYDREERRFVHAATYRDWVIRAFNDDMPYDRFLLLQIAADQLVSTNSPDLAAMGFITGGRRFLGVTHDIIDDRIDVVTRGTMALTVQCARCHDHKYDPIPTKDYYSLYGVFHGSDDKLVALHESADAELAKRRKKYSDMMAKRREEASARLRARVADYLTAQLELSKYPEEGFDQIFSADDIIPASVRRWRDYLATNENPDDPIFGPWHRLKGLSGDAFKRAAVEISEEREKWNSIVAYAFVAPVRDMREVAQRYGRVFADLDGNRSAAAAELRAVLREPSSPTVIPDTGIASNEGFFPTSQLEEMWKLNGDVERRLIELGAPAALVVAEHDPEPWPRVFKRGSASQLGEVVPRQFLSVLSHGGRKPFGKGNGRLELAKAIVSPDNPLTARVMVNRIWQHHFGNGLVRTPSDFGLRADAPSHPELLDWLALKFIAEGWSVKAVHRLILSSAVYQTGSDPSPEAIGKDQDNRLLARFPVRRLSFEQLRDSMLAASAELDETMGGKAAPILEARNRRRTVYAMVDRQYLPGVFRTFDFANPDIHVAVRHETTVPQQALFFLNGPFSASRARELAAESCKLNEEKRVEHLYESLFQRKPSHSEIAAGLRFISAAEALPPPTPPPAPEPAWHYGTGEYDETAKRLKSFTLLPHFTGMAWQGAESWPGGETGWAQLTAQGGHPGNTRAYACVRRWTAPRDVTVKISGRIIHEPEAGDGVRAFIVSSRDGELKSAKAHKNKVEMSAEKVTLKAGDSLDFVVDIGDNLNNDQFLWAPKISSESENWNAASDFGGPVTQPPYLNAWEQYAQVLLLSNEFAFVD
jgi:hypothetical protein